MNHPLNKQYEPQRKNQGEEYVLPCKKKGGNSWSEGEENERNNFPVICGDVLVVGGISLT